MKLTKSEILCLEAMAGQPGWLYTFKRVADLCCLNMSQTRRAVRRLVRKDLAYYSPCFKVGGGWGADEGQLGGSGHGITAAGLIEFNLLAAARDTKRKQTNAQ